jgi:hypothetical protein
MQLKISYSIHRNLNVKGNNDRSWDYTLQVGAPQPALAPADPAYGQGPPMQNGAPPAYGYQAAPAGGAPAYHAPQSHHHGHHSNEPVIVTGGCMSISTLAPCRTASFETNYQQRLCILYCYL